eukprot:9500070-Pyramimonas_sp.AAC.2
MLHTHLAHREASVVIWSDETTSGNQLRSDMKRNFLSTYWCIAELPEFFRNSDHGWWPIGVLSHDAVKSVKAEESGIIRHVLRFFFLGHQNFERGIRLRMGSVGFIRITGRLAAVLQDEKGHKQVASVKGAS